MSESLETASAIGSLRLLLVEDSQDDADLVILELKRCGLLSTWKRVDTEAAMRAVLRAEQFDLIISDYSMPGFGAFQALAVANESELDLPFLIVSGTIGEDVAIRAMKLGAQDYLMKGNLARLAAAVEREVREAAVRRARRASESARRDEARISDALARAGRELIASMNTPEVLDRLCRIAAEALGCAATCTLLHDDISGLYKIVADYGGSEEERAALQVVELPPEVIQPVIADLPASGVFQAAGEECRSLAPAAALVRRGCNRVLLVGLKRGVDIFGLLVAGTDALDVPFDRCQERIAEGLGQLASLALENVRLFETAQNANRLKSDFVATMSHELRTPLHIIMGYNTLLLEGGCGDITADQADALQRIDRNTKQLIELIEATLDMSRLESGRVDLEVRAVEVRRLMEQVESFTSEARKKKGITLSWQVEEGLPLLHTDATKLKVVIQNLVDNAIKFTAEGRVSVSARNNAGMLEIAVSDAGIGIEPELLPVIFEAFRQGDSRPTRSYEGVGLGLYIVRRMLDVLGGKVTVHSTPGHGASFHVWLPFNVAARKGAISPPVRAAS